MARVPVTVAGETIRCGWGLKVGTRVKCGQPFRIRDPKLANRSPRRRGA